MSIPKAVTDLTPACEAVVAALRSKQTAYRRGHRKGKFWRGSTEDAADHSRVTKIAEVPDGLNDDGSVRMRREVQPGKTLADMTAGATPPTQTDVEISEYQGPQGAGWFATFTAKRGSKVYTMTLDGDGPETFARDWSEVVPDA